MEYFQTFSIYFYSKQFYKAAWLILPFPPYLDGVGTLVCSLPLAPDLMSVILRSGSFQCTQILEKTTEFLGLPRELFPILRKLPKIPIVFWL